VSDRAAPARAETFMNIESGTRTVARALPWAATEALGVAVMSAISIAVVARILAPQDFGIIALGQAAAQLAEFIAAAGIGEALIQRRALGERHIDTAFWALLGFGAAGFLACVTLAVPLASFYALPVLSGVLVAQASSCLFSAINAVPTAILARELRIRTLALRSLSAYAVQITTTISLAVAGLGLWSVVLGAILQNIASSIILWSAYARRPRARFSVRDLKDLLSFGLPAMLEGLAWVAAVRTFVILVGLVHGLQALGYLSFALRTTEMVASLLNSIAGRLALPFFAQIQGDPSRLRQAFLLGTRTVTAVSTPIFVGLLVTASDWVPLIFGRKWWPAVLLVQIICLVRVTAFNRMLVGPCLKALGRPAVLLVPAIVGCAVMLAVLAATLGGNIVDAAWAWGARLVAVLPISLYIVRRVAEIPILEQLRATAAAIAAAAMMALVVWFWMSWLAEVPAMLRLGTSIVLGAVVYAGALLAFDRSLVLHWTRAYETRLWPVQAFSVWRQQKSSAG
jgi:teichuronic acid exporter